MAMILGRSPPECGRTAFARRSGQALLPTVLLLLLAGCRGGGERTKDDPLVGSTPLSLQKDPPYSSGPAASGSVPPPPKLPPVPASHSVTTQAEATIATTPTPATPTAGPGSPAASGPPSSSSGATLAAPQPLGDNSTARFVPTAGPVAPSSVPCTCPPAASASPAAPAAAGSYELLQKQLQDQGVRHQWWENTAETSEWRLRCSVLTDPRTPDLFTTYTASSTGDNGLGAMRAILEQIARDRQNPR